MAKLSKRRIEHLTEVTFSRGKIRQNPGSNCDQFFTLYIQAIPDYDYSNWTAGDLEDLRDAITAFLKDRKENANE